jgi:thioredoxin reductase
MNNKVYDVAIIGSGPSGIAAALELSKYNINILLIDNNERVGGQIYRASPPEFKSDESVEEMQIQKDLEEKIKKSNIVYKPNHTVWQISENFRIDGFTKLTFSIFASSSVQFQFYPSDTINIARGLGNNPVSKQYGSPKIIRPAAR